MDEKNLSYERLEIKTKPNNNIEGVIYVIGFIISLVFFLKLNFNRLLLGNLLEVFNILNCLIVITMLTFLFFSVDKLNLKQSVYIKFIGEKIAIYNGFFREDTVVNMKSVYEIIDTDDKIVIILKNHKDYINIIKRNMNLKELKKLIDILSTYAPVKNMYYKVPKTK
ncbi:hypothetical protein ACFIJ5_01775 [Haloimpatiens sp. FM7330]|uniref:hypothetical protein n=1 Tax=Haloimpatiens sp. FM7330 TaxID=3298610 RepID=UPI0036261A36